MSLQKTSCLWSKSENILQTKYWNDPPNLVSVEIPTVEPTAELLLLVDHWYLYLLHIVCPFTTFHPSITISPIILILWAPQPFLAVLPGYHVRIPKLFWTRLHPHILNGLALDPIGRLRLIKNERWVQLVCCSQYAFHFPSGFHRTNWTCVDHCV